MSFAESGRSKRSPAEVVEHLSAAMAIFANENLLETPADLEDTMAYILSCEREILEQGVTDDSDPNLHAVRAYKGMLRALMRQRSDAA